MHTIDGSTGEEDVFEEPVSTELLSREAALRCFGSTALQEKLDAENVESENGHDDTDDEMKKSQLKEKKTASVVPASALLADAAEEMRVVSDLAPLVQCHRLAFDRATQPPGADVSHSSAARTALSRTRLQHWANRLHSAYSRAEHTVPLQMQRMLRSVQLLRGRLVLSLDERGAGATLTFAPFVHTPLHLREDENGELIPATAPPGDAQQHRDNTDDSTTAASDVHEHVTGNAALKKAQHELQQAVVSDTKRQLAKSAAISDTGVGLQVESAIAQADEHSNAWLVWAMQRVVQQYQMKLPKSTRGYQSQTPLLDELVDAAAAYSSSPSASSSSASSASVVY